jgi:hypothetical protein
LNLFKSPIHRWLDSDPLAQLEPPMVENEFIDSANGFSFTILPTFLAMQNMITSITVSNAIIRGLVTAKHRTEIHSIPRSNAGYFTV